MAITKIRTRFWLLFAAIALTACVWGGYEAVTYAARQHLVHASYAPAPDGMVFVPPGYFIQGTDDPSAELDERPARRRFLPGFYIDRHEVTNREYKAFKPDHTYPEGADDLPATKVLKADAEAYARSIGKRLPTDAEWEKAARGTDGRAYPWGDEFDTARCNAGERQALKPVGSYPSGASPYGCLDMSGNAWEWVADVHRDSFWFPSANVTDRGILRGGANGYGPQQARTTYHGFEAIDTTCNDVSFRCVKDAEMLP